MATNLYFNDGVEKVRAYHIDDEENTYKVFLYITDVPDKSYGPYCFCPKFNNFSKNKSYIKRQVLLNKIFNNRLYDMYVPSESTIDCCGPKGTIIISDQSYPHRGLPQINGNLRMVLVNSFFPV